MPIAAAIPIVGSLISSLFGGGKSKDGGSSGGLGGIIKQAVNPVTSIVNGIMAASAAHKAKKAFVPIENFRQQAFLSNLEGKRKALATGSLYKPQQDAITQQGMFASNNAMRSTGGDIGTTIGALNRINRSTGRNLNELYGNMSMEGLQLDGLIGQTVQSMANREYQIKMGNKMQKLAQAEQMKKDAGANIMGTLKQWGAQGSETASPQATVMPRATTSVFGGNTQSYTPSNLLPFDASGNYQLGQPSNYVQSPTSVGGNTQSMGIFDDGNRGVIGSNPLQLQPQPYSQQTYGSW